MLDKVAVISDVHGNLEALKAVLADIEERKIDKIVCLGDIIAKGTHQSECLSLIKNNCRVILQGNCDNYFTSKIDLSNKNGIQTERIIWNKSKLTDEEAEYLQGLPYCYEFYMSGRLIRLFHAHPRQIDRFIGNIDTIERLYELFLPSDNTISDLMADVVIYGHIHTPFIQKIYNRTIINAGSVGNALDVFRNKEKDANVKNTSVANYVIISGKYDSRDLDEKLSYELVNVPYNIEKELAENTDNIEIEAYEEEIRNGKYRDMKKIYDSFDLRGINKDNI